MGLGEAPLLGGGPVMRPRKAPLPMVIDWLMADFSVPFTKTSFQHFCAPDGGMPTFVGTQALTMLGGTGKACGGELRMAYSMKSCQMGPAPSIPITSFMGVWLLLPAHTATDSVGV